METEKIQYNYKYEDEIIDLLKATWDFSLHFKNIRNNDVLYSLYFQEILLKCSYSRLVIDEKKHVLGVIFAEIDESSNRWKIFKLRTKMFLGVLKGFYGKRKTAFSFFYQYGKECKTLYDGASFDNEVFLLMVSPLAKGMGLGKSLVNNYLKECKSNGVSKIGLQTGSDCDYSFYDYLGFSRESSLYTDMYEKGTEDENFFIYTKEV